MTNQPSQEKRERPITVWFCSATGDAIKVSNASDEEYDYRDCSCGGPLERFPVVPASEIESLRAVVQGLVATLDEAIELADEGWVYASDYFREKWGCDEELEKLRAALKQAQETLEGGTDG